MITTGRITDKFDISKDVCNRTHLITVDCRQLTEHDVRIRYMSPQP